MSTLLEQASLIMIPSGYKEDVVYSVIPETGAGDLSFTRASNGTRINSAGLVEVCPWNLLQQSETFDNAYWNLYQATITSNTTTAPNGTTTADTLNSGSGFSGVVYTSAIFSAGDILTLSIYAKANTSSILQLGTTDGTDRSANFNLSTGVVVSSVGVTASIESVGNGWYRCSVSRTMLNPANFFVVEGTGSLSLFIWGAQTNVGVSAKPYFPTTDRLNVPRLTYQNGGGGCPSLLLEKQSTNLVSWSDDFSNSDWGKYHCSVSTNQTTSPDGTQNADKMTLSGSSGTYTGLVYRTTTPAANSIYMKNDSIGSGKFYIQVDGVGNAKWNSDGTLNSVSGGTATNGENMGNGWFRFAYVVTSGAYINCGIVDGTTGDSIFIWGAQVEAGSYPTSYIPTTTASATRVADTYQKAGIGNTSTAGTLFYEFGGYQPSIPANAQYLLQLFAGSSVGDAFFSDANSISIINQGANIEGRNDGFSTTLFSFTPTSATVKVALRYNGTNVVAFVNGVKQTVYSDTAVGVKNAIRVNNGEYGSQATKQLIFFPTALTDAECISLTTI
jgi:hypothetical protein